MGSGILFHWREFLGEEDKSDFFPVKWRSIQKDMEAENGKGTFYRKRDAEKIRKDYQKRKI
ncbi:MAG: hypothetical protein Q4E67_01950 [Planctomycetia bacterium]|nr:hypothetical protein [Planctomycetia bacterium]